MSAPHPQGLGAATRARRCAGARRHRGGRRRLHQPARHREPAERRSRSRTDRARCSGAHAREFDQGLDRTHARRRRHRRSRDHPARTRTRLRPRHLEYARTRPGMRTADRDRQIAVAIPRAICASHCPTRSASAATTAASRSRARRRHERACSRSPSKASACGRRACRTGKPRAACLTRRDDVAADAHVRPATSLLAPNERRRAPESVLLALDVAQQACAMAQRDPRALPNVFASAYGDLAINDYLCATLARAPLELSPTKIPQLRAQRAGRLLDDRDRLHGDFDRGQRRCGNVRRGPARSCAARAQRIAPRYCLSPTTSPRAVRWRTSSNRATRSRLRWCSRRDATETRRVCACIHALLLHRRTCAAARCLHASYRGQSGRASLPLLAALARREPRSWTLAPSPHSHLHTGDFVLIEQNAQIPQAGAAATDAQGRHRGDPGAERGARDPRRRRSTRCALRKSHRRRRRLQRPHQRSRRRSAARTHPPRNAARQGAARCGMVSARALELGCRRRADHGRRRPARRPPICRACSPRRSSTPTTSSSARACSARMRSRARTASAIAQADFWVSWACGQRVADSQSGQRYYPRAVVELALHSAARRLRVRERNPDRSGASAACARCRCRFIRATRTTAAPATSSRCATSRASRA